MATLSSGVLLRTRSGETLEVRNGVLYSENIEKVKAALNEDLHSKLSTDRQMAASYLRLIATAGL